MTKYRKSLLLGHPFWRALFLCTLFLLSSLVWSACGAPAGPPCQTDAECPQGSYCAQVDKGKMQCTQRSNNDSGPPDQTNPPPDRSNPPDSHLPTACIPTPYDAATDPGNGGQSTVLDELDKAFFQTLRTIYHASQQCHDKIWGGQYQMHKIPTYVVNIGSGSAGQGQGVRGFLINHPAPPAGAMLIDSRLVYGIPNVYLHNGDKANITAPGFSFGMDIAGVKSYAFEYGSDDDFINPIKGRDCFALFIHEGFHRAQEFEEKWAPAPGSQDISRYPTDANTLALAMLEGRILVAGYQGADPKTHLEYLIAVQTERFKVDGSGVLKAHDALQEWLEGTAQYTEHHYLKIIGMPYTDDEINSLPKRLSLLETLTNNGQTPTKEDLLNFVTARFYATGAIIGILLDRLGDASWKDQIRRGKTFHTILQERYSSNLSQRLTEAKAKYNFSQLQSLGETYAQLK